jgi:WD40 repeat protein
VKCTPLRLLAMCLATPLLLFQVNLTGCPFLSPGTGGTVGGGGVFNLPPTPVITADVVRGVAPLTVQFSSSNSSDDGLIVRRRWDFDNGQTSPDIAPRVTFETTGTFNVTLTITDDAGVSATRTQPIVVTVAPVPVIRVDRTAAESAPAVFNFDGSESTDPDGTIVSYRWDFGDGAREVLPVVPHTYATPGTYRARLTVTDSAGVTAVAEQLISVGIPRPQITFRQPPANVTNLVLSPASPLWVVAETVVTPGVARTTLAGLDRDRDACDAIAVLYASQTGIEKERLGDLSDAVSAVAFSPNGQFFAVATADGQIQVFNAATARPLNQMNVGGAITDMEFSPDGTRLAVALDSGVVQVRNRGTGLLVFELTGHNAGVNAVAYSPDGVLLASAGDDNRAIVWNATSGAQLLNLVGHSDAVTDVAFNPADPRQLATASADHTARTWNANNGAVQDVFTAGAGGHNSGVNAVSFTPTGDGLITAGDDGMAILWTLSPATVVRKFSGHADRILSVAVDPDGAMLLTGSADRSLRLWNLETGALVQTLQPCRSPITSVAFSSDGSEFLAGVQARNSIQLDTIPSGGNDLDLSIPAQLSLANVPPGAYSLWVQIDTDRTEPVRTYSNTTVNVIEDYTGEVNAFTPRIPLINEQASIVVAPTSNRQIFDLGPFSQGDRLDLALLSTPGYQPTFSAHLYSVQLFESNLELFAWYRSGLTLFSTDTRNVISRNTSNLFVVTDTGTSVSVRVQRAAGIAPRPQRIFLNFAGVPSLRVGGEGPFVAPALTAPLVNPNFTEGDTSVMRNRITQTVRDAFATWNIDVSSSDEGPAPAPPYQTVYFARRGPTDVLSLADYTDPRNSTLTGNAMVFMTAVGDLYPTATPEEVGQIGGQLAARESGRLLGLVDVSNAADIMSPTDPFPGGVRSFTVSPIAPTAIVPQPIGNQNAPQILTDLTGLRVGP